MSSVSPPRTATNTSDGHQRTTAAGADTRRNEGDAGGEHDEDRVVDRAELRHAEVELTLQRRQPDQHRAPTA